MKKRKSESESVGLKGARALGDKKVSSLLHFSWSARHAGAPAGKQLHRKKAKSHGGKAVSSQSQQKKK